MFVCIDAEVEHSLKDSYGWLFNKRIMQKKLFTSARKLANTYKKHISHGEAALQPVLELCV